MAHAFDAMRRGADMYYTLRSYEAMEMLAREGIPVQSHIGLIPTFSQYCGGLRGWGRKADEAMQIFTTLKRMEEVGVFAVEAECIAEEVLEAINLKTSIVTFRSIWQRRRCHHILRSGYLGGRRRNPPKHAHAFGDLGRLHSRSMKSALLHWAPFIKKWS